MGTRPSYSDYRLHIETLLKAALLAADPAAAVRRCFVPSDFEGAAKVFLVGAGKAGAAMGDAAARILADRLTAGVIVVPNLPLTAPDRVRFIRGGHPIPTEGSLAAGLAMADLLAKTTPHDLVVALISGGGSALLELPREGLSLEDLQATYAALLRSGATITEVNAVRRRLSRIKAGGLALLARPARVIGLILSDVVGNPLDVVASGPTVISKTTSGDALAVIDRYQMRSTLPGTVLDHLVKPGSSSEIDETSFIENRLIASNRQAGEAAVSAASELGFEAVYLGDQWEGEARDVGKKFAESARAARNPQCLVAGGESTVTVRGSGKGGRNQEAALAAALTLSGRPNIVVATFATDGVDGPTDAAGAIATATTAARARMLGLDPAQHLENNNSYPFFEKLGDLIVTGPTGTNVNDLMFGLVY